MEENINIESIWAIIHPSIIKVTKPSFDAGSFARAVEDAFKLIEVEVRRCYKERTRITNAHGTNLMENAFSNANGGPILEFASSSEFSDGGIQEGYKLMFKGSMLAIRNPKAHAIETIEREDALRKLAFASMLMYKLDTIKSK